MAEDPQQSSADVAEMELIVRGMLAEREQLRTGRATISGTVVRRNREDPETKGPVHGLYVFDYDLDHLRYDNQEPYFTRYLSPETGLPKDRDEVKAMPGAVFPRRLCFVRNSEYSARWTRKGVDTRSEIDLIEPDGDLGGGDEYLHHFYDIRCVGLLDYFSWGRNPTVHELLEGFLAQSVAGMEREGDLTTLTFQSETLRSVMVIEMNSGFRPVSLTVNSLTDPFTCTATTAWEKVNDCDVPLEMRLAWNIPQSNSGGEYYLKYHWEMVNEAIDPKDFDYHSFPDIPLDMDIDVVDYRGSKRSVLGKWAGDGAVVPIVDNWAPTMIAVDKEIEPGFPWRMAILIGCNVLFLMAMIAWWFYSKGKPTGGT